MRIGRNLPASAGFSPAKKPVVCSMADQGATRLTDQGMGPLAGAVHRLEHCAEALIVMQGFKNQKTAVKDDLKCPGVEAGQGESHGRNAHHCIQPAPSWARSRRCLQFTIMNQKKRPSTSSDWPRFSYGRKMMRAAKQFDQIILIQSAKPVFDETAAWIFQT